MLKAGYQKRRRSSTLAGTIWTQNMYFQDFTMQLLMQKLCKNFIDIQNRNKLWPVGNWLFRKHCVRLWRHSWRRWAVVKPLSSGVHAITTPFSWTRSAEPSSSWCNAIQRELGSTLDLGSADLRSWTTLVQRALTELKQKVTTLTLLSLLRWRSMRWDRWRPGGATGVNATPGPPR